MVELTCPTCGVKRTAAFIRINAAVRCAGCQHVWRISASQVQRVAPGTPSSASAEPTPVPTAAVITDEPASPPEDPLGGSSVTGLSGLTEIMQSEPNELPPLATEPAAALPRGKPSRQPSVLTPAQRRAARSRRRTAVLLITLLALVIAIGGVGLILIQKLGDEPTATEVDRDPAVQTPRPSEPEDPALDSAGAH